VPDFLERLGVEIPVVQAGMGGGIAPHGLAVAVAEAGGLGQIGMQAPEAFRAGLQEARRLTAKPIAVNVIVPLAQRVDWEIASEADAVVTHWEGSPRRRTAKPWIHTVGSPEEARTAVAAGADAVIAQGIEAGGHVRGKVSAMDLLERVKAAVPPDYPVLLAGGVAERADVERALEAGAVAAVAGTRFVATPESGAHPGYKERVVEGSSTLLTELFGLGWARAPHRVLPNETTRRWLAKNVRGPAHVRALHTALGPVAHRIPTRIRDRFATRNSAGPLDLTPGPPSEGMSDETLETHPLYAGETVARVNDIRPAAEIVRELTPH
jgi:NAD(P)H-dependent flavin oxidoreductase YrpB (nitropropane dioxygenase family)